MTLQDDYYQHDFQYWIWLLVIVSFFTTIAYEQVLLANDRVRELLKRYPSLISHFFFFFFFFSFLFHKIKHLSLWVIQDADLIVLQPVDEDALPQQVQGCRARHGDYEVASSQAHSLRRARQARILPGDHSLRHATTPRCCWIAG
jgi:hypothetical protein